MDNFGFNPEIKGPQSLVVLQGVEVTVSMGAEVAHDIKSYCIEGYGFCRGVPLAKGSDKDIVLKKDDIPYIICRHKGDKGVLVFIGTEVESDVLYISELFQSDKVAGYPRRLIIEVIQSLLG